MHNHEILDKIREVNGPIPELEPQIVKSRHLLTYYAGVLLRRSEEDYMDFCLAWGLPLDWMLSNPNEPLEPKDVAFTPEGQRMILNLTREDFYEGGYAADLLKHLIKLGPGSLTPAIKKKLFNLTRHEEISIDGPTEWRKDIEIRVPSFFFSLLRGGYFTPEDEKMGREIADNLALKVIDAYYNASRIIRDGGHVYTGGVEKLMACASKEINDDFVNVLKTVIGEPYRELNSKASIDAINKLSGQEQQRAIKKHAEDVANLLKSLPKSLNPPKRDIDWGLRNEGR